MSDEALVELLASKQAHDALTELHARYAQRVLGYFIKMFNGDKAKAQDFVQDLFVKILHKHHQFDPSRKFYTWMFTIASNMCKTEFRKVHPTSIDVKSEQLVWSEDRQSKKTFQEALKKALERLEETHRSVFVLRYQSNLSLKEISEIKQIPVGTVKSRLFNATRKMAEELKEFKPSESGLFKLN